MPKPRSYTQLRTTLEQNFFPHFLFITHSKILFRPVITMLDNGKNKELRNCFQKLWKILFDNCNDSKISDPLPKLTYVLKCDDL